MDIKALPTHPETIRPKKREAACLLAFLLTGHMPLSLAQDPLASIRQCAAESDDGRRLACYDKEFRALGTSPPSQPKTSAPAAAAPPSTEQQFGMNGRIERDKHVTQPPKLDKLTGRVAAVWHKPYGEAVFRLENGQVWEEANGEKPLALKAGDEVTIDSGVLGVYYLSFGRNASVRVKRTR